jgi:hypothetical protein
MVREGRGSQFRALLAGILPTDWISLPGNCWRRLCAAAGDAARSADLNGGLEYTSDLAVKFVEGKATKEYSAAMKEFEETEEIKIRRELARRSAEDDLRKRKAEADKAEVEVDLVRAQADEARLRAVEARLRIDQGIVDFCCQAKGRRNSGDASGFEWHPHVMCSARSGWLRLARLLRPHDSCPVRTGFV